MKNVAICFARGGSKGLPRKNVQLLLGKTLLQRAIEVAQKSTLIDKVFVSTEDSEIIEIAKENGAEVIVRPSNLAGDHTPEWEAWRHAVEFVSEQYGEFENMVSVPATSPLRILQDIDTAINQRNNSGADVCLAVTESHRNPYFNMVRRVAPGRVRLAIEPLETISRRQDVPAIYDITTVVYVVRSEFIISKQGIFEGQVTYVQIPKKRSIDIDDAEDLKLAEFLAKESGIFDDE